MSEASTSLGANPFTYYGQQSNSEVENAKNHFIESWVPATLIATVAAAVATPLAVLAGMKWGALALTTMGLGFIATPASGIALGILAAAIVTIITLAVVLAIQSCCRCQNSGGANRRMPLVDVGLNGSSDTPIGDDLENSGEANRQMVPVEVRLNDNFDNPLFAVEIGLEGNKLLRGYLEKREDQWFCVIGQHDYQVRPDELKNHQSIIVNAACHKIGYAIPITIEELNKRHERREGIDKLTAIPCCDAPFLMR